MNETHRRPGRFKLLCFAVSIFHGSTFNWSYGEVTGTVSKEQDSPTGKNTIKKANTEKVILLSDKTEPERDENEKRPSEDREQWQKRRKEPKTSAFSSFFQDKGIHNKTSGGSYLRLGLRHHRLPRDTGSATNQHDLKNLTCPPVLSCMHNCSTEMDPGRDSRLDRCFCDKYCEMFLDCCADYARACRNTSRRLEMSKYEQGQWQCQLDKNNDKTVWMISQCPATNTTLDDLRENCSNSVQTNFKDTVPVKDSKGISYKNRFCALCHGIPTSEIQFYDAESSCNNSVVTIQISNITSTYTNCSFLRWKIPETFPRRYCLQTKGNESCSLQSAFLKEKCATNIPGIVRDLGVTGHYYLNQYCALCGNVTRYRCGPDVFDGIRLIGKTRPVVMSVPMEHGSQETVVRCESGKVYDIATRECRDAFDLDLSPVVPFLYRYTAVVVLRSLVPIPQKRISHLRNVVREAIISHLRDNDFDFLNLKFKYENNTVYSIDMALAPRYPISVIELNFKMNLALNFNIKTAKISFITIKKTWKPILCLKIDTYKPSEYTLISSYYSAVYINSTGDVIPPMNYFAEKFNKQKVKGGSLIPEGNIQVCRKSQSNCSGVFIPLKKHEYVILPNVSLYRNQTGESMDFLMLNGTAYVCVDYSSYYKTNIKQSVSRKLLDLLSFIGICVSLPCLVLVLFTYSLFKELRTVPGVNLMNLTFSLFLTHTLLFGIKATHTKAVCTAIAALLHYLYLVTFTWMSIIAFDTYRTFSRTCYSRQRSNSCRFTALGWLPAFVFVVTCFNLDISGKVAIGYGDDHYCWISNPRLNLFLFVIPVAFLVTFNFIVYILIVYWIQKVKKQTRNIVNTPSNLKNVWLFVKLATLMGFTWIFGFLRILWSDYFAYPFVIFTSLEGVYIMVAFVFTTRVKNMYRDLFVAKKTAPVETYDTRL